ncbi:MAG: HAMP domain-containing sensor histidine kinase [Acidimicrobiia bacterium]
MSLRTRLVISFTVLLLVVIAAVGIVASRSLEGILLAQIDRTLVGFANRGPAPPFEFGFAGQQPSEEEADFLVSIAEVVVDGDGSVLFSRPSGFQDDPDPLPDVGDIPDTTEPFTIPAVDGSLEYRAIATTLPEELTDPLEITLVRAAPLTSVDEATNSLIRSLLIAGAAVLVLGGVATWWTVKRAMRPVEQMVDTAEAIASGDLSKRVPELEPGTELGRLGGSLNEMLTHIEAAVETEKEAHERLRQFIADASHELRTPVTAISGYAELRRKGGLTTPEEEDKAWLRIESEGHRMGSLVEDLLVLTRLGQGQPLELAEVDLVQVARDAAADHSVVDPERPITVTGPESLLIEADEERLHQVVTNLLSNVRVHTPPWTTVEVELSEANGNAVIEVADNGTGFPPTSIDHVFDRFYRADPSRSRRSGGSGLGLAIVDAIVTAHGGATKASNVEGGGAKITITLPVAPHSEPGL